jgi:hypothetical protein
MRRVEKRPCFWHRFAVAVILAGPGNRDPGSPEPRFLLALATISRSARIAGRRGCDSCWSWQSRSCRRSQIAGTMLLASAVSDLPIGAKLPAARRGCDSCWSWRSRFQNARTMILGGPEKYSSAQRRIKSLYSPEPPARHDSRWSWQRSPDRRETAGRRGCDSCWSWQVRSRIARTLILVGPEKYSSAQRPTIRDRLLDMIPASAVSDLPFGAVLPIAVAVILVGPGDHDPRTPEL